MDIKKPGNKFNKMNNDFDEDNGDNFLKFDEEPQQKFDNF